MDKELLKKIAKSIQSIVFEFVRNYDLSWDKQLNNQLLLLKNRAEEIDSRAFVVIVVGPVKSGKSTFVNLLAHSNVSPTHYLECTVRPSIISKKNGEKCLITTYTYIRENEKNCRETCNYVDMVIDAIKQLPGANMEGIDVKEFDLNEQNLKNYVELSLNEDWCTDKNKFLTSITAEGGKFLNEDIYLVDMPGFDGIEANLDEDYYRTIANRADLVIFIQSSNSAITKISNQFFNLLQDGNRCVPVYLIHNCFDSAYWRNPSFKENKIKEQVAEAQNKIKEVGFTLSNEQCLSINLGKVEDYKNIEKRDIVRDGYREELEESAKKFEKLENELYESVSSTQQVTRLNNCIGRIDIEKNKLLTLAEGKINHLQEKLKCYESVCQTFEHLQQDTCLVCKNDDFVFRIDTEDLCEKIRDMAQTYSLYNVRKKRYSKNETCCLVDGILTTVAGLIEESIVASIENNNGIDIIDQLTQLRFLNIKNELVKIPFVVEDDLKRIEFSDSEEEFSIDISSEILNAYNSKEQVRGTFLFIKHNEKSVKDIYLKKAIDFIVGPQNQPEIKGILQSVIVPKIVKSYQTHMASIIENRKRRYLDYLMELKIIILNKIIPDKKEHATRIDQLEGMCSKLRDLNCERRFEIL